MQITYFGIDATNCKRSIYVGFHFYGTPQNGIIACRAFISRERMTNKTGYAVGVPYQMRELMNDMYLPGLNNMKPLRGL
jgi:hypothetical protein